MSVYLTECTCANGHRIIGLGWEGEEREQPEAERMLRNQVATLVSAGLLNGYCGMCKSTVFRYSSKSVPGGSLEGAMPGLLRDEEREIQQGMASGELDPDMVAVFELLRRRPRRTH